METQNTSPTPKAQASQEQAPTQVQEQTQAQEQTPTQTPEAPAIKFAATENFEAFIISFIWFSP